MSALSQLQRPRIIVGLGKTGLSCVRYLRHEKLPSPLIVVDTRSDPPGLAEFKSHYPTVPVHLGPLATDSIRALLLQAKDIIVSPGISIQDPTLAECAAKGIPLIGDIELFARAVKKPVIAITGSNAKGTVTTWVGDMVRAAGIYGAVGGNIGTPALDLFDAKKAPELFVLELSSFQLETTYSLAPKAAVILNISPDHMDRYQSLDDYTLAKQRIYHQASVIVSNREDKRTLPQTRALLSQVTFGLSAPKNAREFGLLTLHPGDVWLSDGKDPLLPVRELKVQGRHNWANALAAIALARAINLPREAIKMALRSFKGLPHRCEWVAEHNQVKWYNDSKGTNIGATQAAIEGLGSTTPGKLILIAGGQGKGADFALLKSPVSRYVKAAVLMGEDAPLLEKALQDCVPLSFVNSMDEAVDKAKQLAAPGDAILLSPACASFDMFNNFEHRGEMFVEAVKGITQND